MRSRGATTFEVTRAASDAYVDNMMKRGQRTVFSQSDCAEARGYYFDRHGQPSLVRPMSAAEGLLRHCFFPLRDYHFD